MQKLAEICIHRPVFATMIVLSLVVVGAAGFFKLGVDRFPSVDLPTVSVRIGLPGGSPEEVESLITQQVEEVVNTVDGISELRSVSGQGTSFVIATFKLDRNLESATQDIRDRVNTLGRRLPEDATPPVIQKFDNDSTPVLTIALSADRSLRELTELADKTVRVQLERVGGVGQVQVVGGLDRAINVWIDAERLAAYQISIAQVRQALERQNADVPGGILTTNKEELTLRTLGRFTDPKQFDDLVIANVNGAPVRLRVEIDFERLCFAYAVGDREWSWLPGHLDASILSDEATGLGAANFTGAFVGMACQDVSGTAHPADFDYFEYRQREYIASHHI